MGLVIPYAHNGEKHDYEPDFIVSLAGAGARYLLLETKDHDELWETKKSAAERWCAAVRADGRWGEWEYRVAWSVGDVAELLMQAASEVRAE
jgi:type III restriction enzyme